jgi:hypothetical protein
VKLGDAGMPGFDVIHAITSNAAEVLGWQDCIGTLENSQVLSRSAGIHWRIMGL